MTITWDQLRAANRKQRERDESGIKSCSECMDNFDIGDIYEIDGEQLCEECKSWVRHPRKNPPPEGELVRVKLDWYGGDYFQSAKKVTYIKPPHKKMKKGCWRWVDANNVRLADQAVDAWKPII